MRVEHASVAGFRLARHDYARAAFHLPIALLGVPTVVFLTTARLVLAVAVVVAWLRGSAPLPLLVAAVGTAAAAMLFWARRFRPVPGEGAAHLA